MTEIDWYIGSDDEFEVEVLLDVDGETPDTARYMVEVWVSRLGFEEFRSFDEEADALKFAKKRARESSGRYRVLKAPKGKGFNRRG